MTFNQNQTFTFNHNYNQNYNKNRNNNGNRGRYRNRSPSRYLKIESRRVPRRARGQSSAATKQETGSGREGARRRVPGVLSLPVKVLRTIR